MLLMKNEIILESDDMTQSICKSARFLASWLFWAIGDAASRLDLDRFMWGFSLYQWSMRRSESIQGGHLGKLWPWGAPIND